MFVRDFMITDVVTANGNATSKEVIDLLFKRHIGCIVIVDEAQRCMGIFTERDAIRLVAQDVPLDSAIQKSMTKNPFTIAEDSTFEEAKSIIAAHKIRHLPVINNDGKLTGLLSVRHVLDEICGL